MYIRVDLSHLNYIEPTMKPLSTHSPIYIKKSPKFCAKSKLKKHVSKTVGKIIKRTLNSNKRQKSINDFFLNHAEKKLYAVKTPPTAKKARKCLFKDSQDNINKPLKSASSAFVDDTSSSSFTYSSNPHRYIEIDISGHSSRLDIEHPLEIVSVGGEHQYSPSPKKQEHDTNFSSQSKGKKPKFDESSKTSKVFEAVVKEVSTYQKPANDVSRGEGFYRFVEGDVEERKENIEYDLDDQDIHWLSLLNKHQKEKHKEIIDENSFEMCLDRLEKVSVHIQLEQLKISHHSVFKHNSDKHTDSGHKEVPEEDIVCSICLDGECLGSNLILFCDSCDLPVHQECYGVPFVPEAQWLCSWCNYKKNVKAGVSGRMNSLKETKNSVNVQKEASKMINGDKQDNGVDVLKDADNASVVSNKSSKDCEVKSKLCNGTAIKNTKEDDGYDSDRLKSEKSFKSVDSNSEDGKRPIRNKHKKNDTDSKKNNKNNEETKIKNNDKVEGEGECCLCPVKGGALKKTNDGRWAHVLCALWIPEIAFGSVDYLEPITKLNEIPGARFKLQCSVCKAKDKGACIQCMNKSCYTAFHVMCAQKIGTYMRIEQGASGSDSPSSIKKYFLCQQHRPPGAKPFMPMYENEDDDGDDDPKKNSERKSNVRGSGRKCKKRNQLLIHDACDIDDDEDDGFYLDDDDEEFSLVKKSKKIKSKSDNEMGYTKKCKKLNKSFKDVDDTNDKSKSKSNKSKNNTKSFKSTSHTTIINPYKLELPSISPKILREIHKECLHTLHSGEEIIGIIYRYWVLKRKQLDGAPLLKAYYTHVMSSHMPRKVSSDKERNASVLDSLKVAKKLRNEMEKVRLLMELVRKREKLKVLMIKLHEQQTNKKLCPWNAGLSSLLEHLQFLDKCDIFARPVPIDQVPGYAKKIKHPMDFSKMRSKVLAYKYQDVDAFIKDFNLIINNCLLFNSKRSIYHKLALRLRKHAQPVLEEYKDKLKNLNKDALPLFEEEEEEEKDDEDRDSKNGSNDIVNNNDGINSDVVDKDSVISSKEEEKNTEIEKEKDKDGNKEDGVDDDKISDDNDDEPAQEIIIHDEYITDDNNNEDNNNDYHDVDSYDKKTDGTYIDNGGYDNKHMGEEDSDVYNDDCDDDFYVETICIDDEEICVIEDNNFNDNKKPADDVDNDKSEYDNDHTDDAADSFVTDDKNKNQDDTAVGKSNVSNDLIEDDEDNDSCQDGTVKVFNTSTTSNKSNGYKEMTGKDDSITGVFESRGTTEGVNDVFYNKSKSNRKNKNMVFKTNKKGNIFEEIGSYVNDCSNCKNEEDHVKNSNEIIQSINIDCRDTLLTFMNSFINLISSSKEKNIQGLEIKCVSDSFDIHNEINSCEDISIQDVIKNTNDKMNFKRLDFSISSELMRRICRNNKEENVECVLKIDERHEEASSEKSSTTSIDTIKPKFVNKLSSRSKNAASFSKSSPKKQTKLSPNNLKTSPIKTKTSPSKSKSTPTKEPKAKKSQPHSSQSPDKISSNHTSPFKKASKNKNKNLPTLGNLTIPLVQVSTNTLIKSFLSDKKRYFNSSNASKSFTKLSSIESLVISSKAKKSIKSNSKSKRNLSSLNSFKLENSPVFEPANTLSSNDSSDFMSFPYKSTTSSSHQATSQTIVTCDCVTTTKTTITTASNSASASSISITSVKNCSAISTKTNTTSTVNNITTFSDHRRTSERTKTATQRYLIDDADFFRAILTPCKTKRRFSFAYDQYNNNNTTNKLNHGTSSNDHNNVLPKKIASNDNNSNSIVNITNKNNDEDDVDSDDVLIDEPPVLSRCPSPYKNEDDNDEGCGDTKKKNSTDKNKSFKKRRNKKGEFIEKSSKCLKNRLMVKSKSSKKKDKESKKSISCYFLDNERKDEKSSCDDSPPTLFRSISANDDDAKIESVIINDSNNENSIDLNKPKQEISETESKSKFDVEVEVKTDKLDKSCNNKDCNEELKKCLSMPNLIKSVTNIHKLEEDNIDGDKNEDDVYDGLRESFSSSDMPQLFEIKDDFKNNTSDTVEINSCEFDRDTIKINSDDKLKTKVNFENPNGEHNESDNGDDVEKHGIDSVGSPKPQSKCKRKYDSVCDDELNVEVMHKKPKLNQNVTFENDEIIVESNANCDKNISIVKSDSSSSGTSSLTATSSNSLLFNHCSSTSIKVSCTLSHNATDLVPASSISLNTPDEDITSFNVTKTNDASSIYGPIDKCLSKSLCSSNLNGDEPCDDVSVTNGGQDNGENNLQKKDCVLSVITKSDNRKEH